jgi:o-succinylbenzoate synthase
MVGRTISSSPLETSPENEGLDLKIERAELHELGLALRERFEISSGASQARRVTLLCLTVDGVDSWSECVASEDPSYSYETTDTAWHILGKFILPGIVGTEFTGPADIMDPIPWVRGHEMAKACVEMAAWNVLAQRGGESLSATLGGVRTHVPVGVSIGIQPDPEALVQKVEGYVEQGYARIKIKIKPGKDLIMLRAVRDAFPELPIMADANSAYTLNDIDTLKRFDELDLMMIEQPLPHDDYLHHARLQSQIATPVCLDESIRSVGDTELAIELGACRIINIKPGRVGGFGQSVAIHDLCLAEGIEVWHGGMLESGVGRAYNLALASLPGFTLPGDISASRRYWEEDIVTPEFVVEGGTMAVPQGVGLGVQLKGDRIASVTTRTLTI